MEKINIDLSRYKVKETRKKTRWQDEITNYIKIFEITKNLHAFIWKKVGKNGKNFPFIEFKIAGLKEYSEKYQVELKSYSGAFINILKKIK